MLNSRHFFRRLQALWRPERVHDEIAEEMQFHIEERTAENIRRGMQPEEARREAQQRFGHLTQIREQGYEVRGGGWIESILQDVAYGWRVLRRNKGFAITAVLTLALGIGANTAIFSVMETVLLHPLRFENADRLFVVHERLPQQDRTFVSGPDFDDVHAQAHSFEKLALTIGYFTFTWTNSVEPQNVRCIGMTEDLFPALGIKPIMGRQYGPEEYHVDGGPVLISEKFWREKLHSDPNVLGRVITLQGSAVPIIGVMPVIPDFYPDTEIWAKIEPELGFMHWRQNKFFPLIGRLKPGVSPAQAEQELTAILRRSPEQAQISAELVPLKDELVGKVQKQLTIVMGAVLLVLVITCVNVIYLLLARTSGRSIEIAMRLSLGAGRGRILRQFVTENLLLVGIGSGVGLLLAVNIVHFVRKFNVGNLPREQQIGINGPVLLFMLAVTVLLTLALAWAPFSILGRLNLNSTLKTGKAAAGLRHFRLLVISEVGCAVVLLVGAGLLVRSFWLVQHVDPGFSPDHVLTAYLRTNEDTQRWHYYNSILERLSQLPGVQATAASDCIPGDIATNSTIDFADRSNDPAKPIAIDGCWISPDFFNVIRAPLLQGRFFTAHDDDKSAPVVIVNATLAQRFWPGENPIGKRIAVSYIGPGRRATTGKFREIVGVVGDLKQRAVDLPTNPVAYMNYHQDETNHVFAAMTVFVRTSGDPRWASDGVRTAIHSINPDQPVTNVRTMEDILSAVLAPRRFSLGLLGSFAALALLLSAIGVYGTIAYSLGQRTREFGVRSAVGATRTNLLAMVMKEGLWLIAIGVAAGIALSLLLTRSMSGLVFGIGTSDPVTIIAAGAFLIAIAAAACFVPAWRACRVDPARALRTE
jgi:putative ABC transport system permease protein